MQKFSLGSECRFLTRVLDVSLVELQMHTQRGIQDKILFEMTRIAFSFDFLKLCIAVQFDE